MREETVAAVLDPIFQHSEITAALYAQSVQRAVTEQTVEILWIRSCVAGKELTSGVLKKRVLTIHGSPPVMTSPGSHSRGMYRFWFQACSKATATSLTLVPVGPVMIRPPTFFSA